MRHCAKRSARVLGVAVPAAGRRDYGSHGSE